MANMNLAVTIPPSGKIQISKAFPSRTGGVGGLGATAAPSHFADAGTLFVQNITFQNQGSNNMFVGDATTTNATGGGIKLTVSGSFTDNFAINYGTYISDWWVAGTAGDVLFVLYNQ